MATGEMAASNMHSRTDGQPPSKANRVTFADPRTKMRRKKRVALKTIEEVETGSVDVFGDNWLVDSPRKIMAEKTTLGIISPLGESLELFYKDVARVVKDERKAAESIAKKLMSILLPKCSKYGKRIGIRFSKAVYPGSTTDGTQVISAHDVDVFMIVELPERKCKIAVLEPGYRMIPLRLFYQGDGGKLDPWRFARSQDGLYLSSLKFNEVIYDLIERSLSFHDEAYPEPYSIEEGCAPIHVKWNEYTIHITPAFFLPTEEVFLISRPYQGDSNPQSDMLWRLSFVLKERKIMRLMNSTDRGMRKKAFLALKGLVAAEHTLHGLFSYQIKTVLFHCFDKDVDTTPKWQRESIETCFMTYLHELHHCLQIKYLPHFYIKGLNLFDNIDEKLLYNLKMRVSYIVNNPRELIRILKKRPKFEESDNSSIDSTDEELVLNQRVTTQQSLPMTDRDTGSQCAVEQLLPETGGTSEKSGSPDPNRSPGVRTVDESSHSEGYSPVVAKANYYSEDKVLDDEHCDP